MNSFEFQKYLQKTRGIIASVMTFSILLISSQSGAAYTKSGNTYSTDGSQSDVQNAINDASNGDIIKIPAGTFVWGAKATCVSVPKRVTLEGEGNGATVIQLATDGPTYGNGTIRISDAATVKDFSVTCAAKSQATLFSTSTANGWRITNIKYDGTGAAGGYFCYVGCVYGLIDHCTLTGYGGNDEMIFIRGPADAWQSPDLMGGTNAVYIEDCTFNGQGYVCDANSNARTVIRFCKITGNIKIDGHGKASNTPARGVRMMEIYNNHWTAPAGSWTAIEIRGGTGVAFNNVSDDKAGVSVFWPNFYLAEYGCTGLWPNFGNVYQTPANYPVDDQIGVGQDPKAGGTAPYYIWSNNAKNLPWQLQFKTIPTAAIQLYVNQMLGALSTYTMADIIKADRDYFIQVANFDGSTGIGIGDKANMLSISATETNVGYWVTNEGNWNTTLPKDSSGNLYVWNGSQWTLKYTPLTYPHPLAQSDSVERPEVIPPANLQLKGITIPQ